MVSKTADSEMADLELPLLELVDLELVDMTQANLDFGAMRKNYPRSLLDRS